MSERKDILSDLPDIEVSVSTDAADTIPSEPIRADKGAHASKPKKKRGKWGKDPAKAQRDGAHQREAQEAEEPSSPKAPASEEPSESEAPSRGEAKRGAHAKSDAGDSEEAALAIPSLEELEAERDRHKSIVRKRRVVGRIGTIVIVAAAVAAICVTFFTPMLNITGESMSPTLEQGNLVLCSRSQTYEQGDVIAFYLDNKVLVKRVIATEGQWVDIDQQGNVYIDGEMLDEPYIGEKAVGKCDVALPCLVGEGEVFVMGDNRANSTDSRSASVGCVDSSQVMGKVFVRVLPPGGIA